MMTDCQGIDMTAGATFGLVRHCDCRAEVAALRAEVNEHIAAYRILNDSFVALRQEYEALKRERTALQIKNDNQAITIATLIQEQLAMERAVDILNIDCDTLEMAEQGAYALGERLRTAERERDAIDEKLGLALDALRRVWRLREPGHAENDCRPSCYTEAGHHLEAELAATLLRREVLGDG